MHKSSCLLRNAICRIKRRISEGAGPDGRGDHPGHGSRKAPNIIDPNIIDFENHVNSGDNAVCNRSRDSGPSSSSRLTAGDRTGIRSGGQSKKPRYYGRAQLQKMIEREVLKQRKRHRKQKSCEYKKRVNRLERKTHKNEERLERQEERIDKVYNWVVSRVGSSGEEILEWATSQNLLYRPDGESHEESDEESSEESSGESSEESDEESDDQGDTGN